PRADYPARSKSRTRIPPMSMARGLHRSTDESSYMNEIHVTPLLSVPEERELAARVAAGDAEARDLLVRANLRLVASVAKGFRGRGVSFEDLVAEGNLGLIRASE